MASERTDINDDAKRHGSESVSVKIYEIDGKKYTVVRHFIGENDINRVVVEIAARRADREMHLP